MNVLAIIPARGGSKGIPRKNIVELCGKPLIAYSIEQALASKLINRTIVSTDDEEIANIARKYGAEVPFIRPSEYARDDSRDIDFLAHALVWLIEHESYLPDIIVLLRPTCPVRRVSTIDQAIVDFSYYGYGYGYGIYPEADSLRSVSPASETPYKMWRIENSYLKPILRQRGIKEAYNMPRQLLPKVFYQNGYIEINLPENILNKGTVTGSRIMAFVIDEEMADIDTEDDLKKAEVLLR